MPRAHDDAICIRQWEWSETSQTVSLFTREHGLVRALAKGSRRPKAPFSGGLEVLTFGQAGLVIRPNTELAILGEWDLRETFPGLRASLEQHYAGLYMAELVQHVLTHHDPHPALFSALLESLRSVGEPSSVRASLLWFQWAALSETGYRPDVSVPGDQAASPDGTLGFCPALGVVQPVEQARRAGVHVWPVRSETLGLLSRLNGELAEVGGLAAPTIIDRAARLLAAYLRWVIGREPRTLQLVFGPDLPV
ncbi:MAG: DNA repair protein RecO [Phycisphaerales bacterium]|nr:DNA repair protein RecO [Phycisphaerales bacterium]